MLLYFFFPFTETTQELLGKINRETKIFEKTKTIILIENLTDYDHPMQA